MRLIDIHFFKKIQYQVLLILLTTKLFHKGNDGLVGLVVEASASRVEGLGFESRLWWDFSGLSHTSDLKIGTPVAPGDIGSVLGLVSPVSVYCDWVS